MIDRALLSIGGAAVTAVVFTVAAARYLLGKRT